MASAVEAALVEMAWPTGVRRPAMKLEGPGRNVSGTRSPSVSTLTTLAVRLLSNSGLSDHTALGSAAKRSFRDSSRDSRLGPETGVKIIFTFTQIGDRKCPPFSSFRMIRIWVTGCSPSRVTRTLKRPQEVLIGAAPSNDRA